MKSIVALLVLSIVTFAALASLAATTVPLMTTDLQSNSQGLTSGGTPISLWEAYAKGHVTIKQVNVTYNMSGHMKTEALGYEVSNLGAVPVLIDEKAMLMSPSPVETSFDPNKTTQDGALTNLTVPPGGSVTFYYGELVAYGYLPDPKWWCAEVLQLVRPNVYVQLGGEILPFVLADMVDNYELMTQNNVHEYMKRHPTLTVGKTPLWSVVPGVAGTNVNITIAVTNIAVYTRYSDNGSAVKAVDSIVKDTIPPDYLYDPSSFNIPPLSLTGNADGSQTLAWKVTIGGADYYKMIHSDFTEPTPYNHVFLRYRLVLPDLMPGRYLLPRATVDTDHDGAEDAHSAKPLLEAYRSNRPPVAEAGGPYVAPEGDMVVLNGNGSYDPDNGPSPLKFRWDFDNDGVADTSWSPSPIIHHVWGDDFIGTVRVLVSDGNLTANATAEVTILNLSPKIDSLSASVKATATLRIAGEKWHDVSAYLVDSGNETLKARLVREPGKPQEMSFGIGIDVTRSSSLKIAYTPDDDKVNGQPNGATPAWLTFTFDSGPPVEMHHTFNVRHPETWNWTVSLNSLLAERNITFTAAATDPGSDDLTFTWDWGDGTPATAKTYYNDGIGPDPYPSPDGNYPFTAIDAQIHSFAVAGTYDIRLTVRDDDDGFDEVTAVMIIP